MSQTTPRPANSPKPVNSKLKADDISEDDEGGNRFMLFNVMPSWLVSFLTHIAVIIVLAIMVMPSRIERTVALESSDQAVEAADSIDMNLDFELDAEDALEASEMPEETVEDITDPLDEVEALPEEQFDVGDMLAAEEAFEGEEIGAFEVSDLVAETGGRSGAAKERMKKKYGATAASEDAVALALKWIAKHQLDDGGWNLDHRIGSGSFRDSPDPGSLTEARAGATALALLPFLGAGSTHKTGEYKEEVRRGLEFLMKRARRGGGNTISYLEPGGSMYSHGLVSIVFCEAYGMTKDPELGKFAQATIWFIEYSQDPSGGGWRYGPKERGDSSAVGWQLMALKSGRITGLDMKQKTYMLAEKFLDSVSHTGGAYYGYGDPPAPNSKPVNARTAVGLLCRMYMGWDKNIPGLVKGMQGISDKGPSIGPSADMYYNYYATQGMKHMGGKNWDKWNKSMRDFLVKTQEKEGNKAGSWHFGQSHTAKKGGRLYTTSLACMTLEVYYRYLPLYGDKAANEEFPLE